jgi:hypothetical protein
MNELTVSVVSNIVSPADTTILPVECQFKLWAVCYELVSNISLLFPEELQGLPGLVQIVPTPLSQAGLKSRTAKLTNHLYRSPISAVKTVPTIMARCTCSEAILLSILLSKFLIRNQGRE